MTLNGAFTGFHAPSAFSYDADTSTLVVAFDGLADDDYTLSLNSSSFQFADPAGNLLDGEAGTLPSGDGTPGGDFVVQFSIDATDETAYPTPLDGKLPNGSLIFDPVAGGSIATAGDTDAFTLDIDAGQTVTVAMFGEGDLQAALELQHPGGTASQAEAAVADGTAILQSITASTTGTYRIIASGVGSSTGDDALRVIINAAIEEEMDEAHTNDDMANAQDIEASFLSLHGGSFTRGAAVGELLGSDDDVDVFQFDLSAGQPATISLAAGNFATLQLFDANSTRGSRSAAVEFHRRSGRDIRDPSYGCQPGSWSV